MYITNCVDDAPRAFTTTQLRIVTCRNKLEMSHQLELRFLKRGPHPQIGSLEVQACEQGFHFYFSKAFAHLS